MCQSGPVPHLLLYNDVRKYPHDNPRTHTDPFVRHDYRLFASSSLRHAPQPLLVPQTARKAPANPNGTAAASSIQPRRPPLLPRGSSPPAVARPVGRRGNRLIRSDYLLTFVPEIKLYSDEHKRSIGRFRGTDAAFRPAFRFHRASASRRHTIRSFIPYESYRERYFVPSPPPFSIFV